MASFIIQILHSAKCFRKGSFFQRTLSWNLTQSQAGNFVEGYGKKLTILHDNNSDVKYVAAKLGVKSEICKPSHVPNMIISFWDGDKHEQLGTLAADDAPEIAKKLDTARQKGIEIVSRYPNFNFRASQKLAILTSQGKRPTAKECLDKAIAEDNLAEAIRNEVAFRGEEPALDPDTGQVYSAEASQERWNVINAHEFNSNLYRGMWETLEQG